MYLWVFFIDQRLSGCSFSADYVLPKPVLINSIDCGVNLALWLPELVLPSLAQPHHLLQTLSIHVFTETDDMGASAVYTVEYHVDPIALHSFIQSSFPDACCMPGSHLRVGAGETTRMNLREQH